MRGGRLQRFNAPVELKLAALWAATMFCYIYGDYFGLYEPGMLAGMAAGRLGPLGPATPGILLAVTLMMAVPSVMVFLSLALPPVIARWSNMALGLAYTAIIALTLPGSPLFYAVLGAVEMALTLGITWLAWRWPRVATHG